MKKMIPLVLALLSIAVFLGLIFKNEWHLNNSQTMYVRLQPVDPRSIIQGDYMALNYQLYFAPQHLSPESTSQANINQEDQIFSGHYFDEVIKNKSSVLTHVELDSQRRVIHSYFELPKNVRTARLILQNPNNRYSELYPASRSFLFAEGLEPCYRNAKFAELKLKENGKALLVNLVDSHLKPLNCESSKSWRQGS